MHLSHKIFLPLFVFQLNVLTVFAVDNSDSLSIKRNTWVDSVFSTLTPDERLAQLFMVAAYSNRDSLYEADLIKYVSDHGIGGVIFFQGGPVRQAQLNNSLQAASKVPLLVAMDAEWGLKMRLDSTTRFPYQMSLGAIQDPHLIYETGAAMARHLKRLGVHVNFAPVLDINNNAENPVINFRSFGENKEEVTWRGFEIAKGMQDQGIMAVAKHFPGHGDTNADSHHSLPTIPFSRTRLDTMELYPFQFAIDHGIGGVMIAHLNVPALDSSGVPSTLSKAIVTDLLKEGMGFEGLIFTDALNMKGVTNFYGPGEVDLLAFKAGNDVMEFSEDVPKAVELIMKEVESGSISQDEIDARCRKILGAKFDAGLNDYHPVEINHLIEDLNSPGDAFLNIQLAQASLTLLENKEDVLPMRELTKTRVASVSVGVHEKTSWQEMLDNYLWMDHFQIAKEAGQGDYDELFSALKEYDVILLGIHGVKVYPRDEFGLTENEIQLINRVASSGKGIITHFGNPYALNFFDSINEAQALIVTYQETDYTQSLAAQLLFGAVDSPGKLPVTVNEHFKFGKGMNVEHLGRFKYSVPEDAGLTTSAMKKIDSLAINAIREKATPGCQVLAAKNGMVVWQKSYGYHTYDSLQPVSNSDLYDLASITKVAGATTALMKLYEEGKFDLDKKLVDYLPYFNNAFGQVTFREILAHQAGLKAWVPYWKTIVKKNGKFKWFTVKEDSSKRFPIKVADGLFVHRKYKKKIYQQIKKTELGEKKYLYSGLIFYLFPQIIEDLSGQPFDEYLYENFYKPLGAKSMVFNPYKRFNPSQIVPTEYDSLFRKQQLHATVHDEGAALMGGLSTNAGLFSTANDLAKLAQMWCNYGEYGGKRYLKEETVKEFTRCQYCETNDNRRALGFDRPLEEPNENGNTAKSVSQSSFGHTGFTGTFVWADPENNIVLVFLSNRVYPTRENTKLFKLNTRTNIQEVIYEAGR